MSHSRSVVAGGTSSVVQAEPSAKAQVHVKRKLGTADAPSMGPNAS
eukprot:CAMPEP_0204501132 /NCGR_PEP_ID=MMETSP0471-20130131/98629_1 /ASSEMBLY_ACC=CAM_ASM_000602 /TAXON_ID=2969 /ORGANISM="Oxyrrhis marina" /LENGTH=45 /DNA_ID= /DNA_START= /DNA_END= /DNA_ORIENTATION=